MTEPALPPLKRFTFNDSRGLTWDVTLNLGAARRVDASDFTELTDKKFSILNPDREFFTDILSDTSLLFAIVWAIVSPQSKDVLGIDAEAKPEKAEKAFIEGLNGRAVKEGRHAVWEAIADFFPDQEAALLTLGRSFEKATVKVSREIAAMEGDIDEMMDAEIKKGMIDMREELKKAAGA